MSFEIIRTNGIHIRETVDIEQRKFALAMDITALEDELARKKAELQQILNEEQAE